MKARESLEALALERFRRESVKPSHSRFGGGRTPAQVVALTLEELSWHPDLVAAFADESARVSVSEPEKTQ